MVVRLSLIKQGTANETNQSVCEQTHEANKQIKIFFWVMFNIIWFWEYCG